MYLSNKKVGISGLSTDPNLSLPVIFLSDLRLDQPVSAVMSLVQDVDGICVSVIENEEILVTQQIHLLQRLKLIHRR